MVYNIKVYEYMNNAEVQMGNAIKVIEIVMPIFVTIYLGIFAR